MNRRHFIRSGLMLAGGTMLAGVSAVMGRSSASAAAESDGHLHDVCVLGIGGAGCNVVEQISGHRDSPRTLRLGRKGEARPLDLELGEDLDADLSSGDFGKLSSAIASAGLTIVVAGLGGHTGSYVAPHVATEARRRGGRCVEVYCLPFSFEGEERWARSLRVLTERAPVADQARILSHDEELEDVALDVILARTDAAMAAAVVAAVTDYRAADRRR